MERDEAQAQHSDAWARFRRCPSSLRRPDLHLRRRPFDYSEQRFVTLGLLDGFVVSIVHTESTQQIRVISFRKATKHEQAIYFKNI